MSLPTNPVKLKGWPIGTAILGLIFLSRLAPPMQAALYETPSWAVTAHAEAAAAYDSNLFARAGGDGDGYATLIPTLSLKRLNSLTDLRFDAFVTSYSFFNKHDLNSIDPGVTMTLRYPSDQETFATEELLLSAARRTEANSDVGGRLSRDELNGHWDGSFLLTGKTAILARAGLTRTKYRTPGFNTNESETAGATLAFVSSDKLQLGAGYDFEHSKSTPDNPGSTATSLNQHLLAFRGRGEFLPKVSGQFFVGVTQDNYHGAVMRNDWDVAVGAVLSWKINERAELAGTADRLTYFSPDGSAATHTRGGLEWTQDIAGGFSLKLGADAENVSFIHSITGRRDHSYSGHVRLKYALTERFSTSVGASYIAQQSNDPINSYRRTVIDVIGTYQF